MRGGSIFEMLRSLVAKRGNSDTLSGMAERPPIRAQGRITETREPGRLFEVEMGNGYRAYAIVEKKGPPPPSENPEGMRVTVDFSPYDMSRCRVVAWLSEA